MTDFDKELILAVAALWGTMGLITRAFYAEMKDRAERCDGEVAELRRQAQATTDQKNRELDEWKRLAMGGRADSSPSGRPTWT